MHTHTHTGISNQFGAFVVGVQDCWFVFCGEHKRKAHDAPCRRIFSEELLKLGVLEKDNL